MAKEYVYASRAIAAGEEMMSVVEREKGYFYFVDAQGNMLRARQERRAPLTDEEVAHRASRKAAVVAFRLKKREAREEAKKRSAANKEARKAVRAAIRDKKRLALEAKVKARILALQAKL
jgi:hypothetical protein